MYSEKGYKVLTAIQVANILAVVGNDPKTYFNPMRVLLGWLHFQAKQEATERSLAKEKRYVRQSWQGPSKERLRKIIGGRAGIGTQLEILRKVGLITMTDKKITVTETPLPGTVPLLKIMCGDNGKNGYKRSPLRPVPIFHEWLREWASPTRMKWKTLLHVIYVGAAVTFKNRKTGEIKDSARFHLKKILELYPKSRSSIERARAELISSKAIVPDKTRSPWVLKQRGHYVGVNTLWKRVVKPDKDTTKVRDQRQEKCTEVRGLYSNQKHTTYVSNQTKHQDVHVGRLSKERFANEERSPDPKPVDGAFSAERMYCEKVRLGILSDIPINRLFFHTAFVRVMRDKKVIHPLKCLEWMIKNDKREFLRDWQEDVALRRIKYLDEKNYCGQKAA